MSDSDGEENVIRYGTPLEPYEEDEVPSKRKFQEPTDQYAVDAHGRRRFHGAFTGGFSAGFGNTVGSQEGWTPQTFKSSRQEKAAVSAQRPEDFMDEEDRSEFGIAPKYMQTSSEFSGQKRPRARGFHDGPIPGEPVLDQILQPVHETAAVHMLKAMGWRPGQGTGLRQSRREKQLAAGQHRVYGCYMPEELRPKETSDHSDSSESEIDYDTLFAPDDYEPYVLSQKNDRFGLGYKGLSRHSVLGSLVGEYGGEDKSSKLVMKEKGKKVSIRGQAFGVGAFEADDDDIYATEDMSHYDYTLGPSKDIMKQPAVKQANNVLQGFTKSSKPYPTVPSYPAPALPRDFAPLPAGARRTRFTPSDAPQRDQGLGRHELTAEARGKLLGEEPPPKPSTKQPESTPIISKKDELLAKIMGRNLDFVSTEKGATSTNSSLGGTNSASDGTNSASVVPNSASVDPNSASNVIKIIDMTGKPDTASDFISIKDSGKEIVKVFKPFATNPKKQARYEMYCAKGALERDGDMDRLSEWERERELVEFEQAAKLYRPLTGIMGDRFTHASQPDDAVNPLTAVAKSSTNYGLASAEQIEAAKKGVYGVMTRTSQQWRPDSIVCKRFNVPEPNVTRLEPKKDDRPKISYSVFSYMESSIHDKNSFTKEQGQFSGSKSHREADTSRNDAKIQNPINTAEESTPRVLPNTVQISKDKNIRVEKISEQNNPSKRLTVAELFIKESEANKEQGKEVTETIESFDKMDLYKSIFLSDSEDEIENTEENKNTTDVADFVDAPKNVARNTSPPRGIFANIDFDELNSWRRDDKSKETNESEKPNNEVIKPNIEEEVETYGPKIPDSLKKRLESEKSDNFQNTSKDSEVQEISSDDSWVDAKEVQTKKLKKKKKHKSKDKKKSKHKKKDR